MAGTVSLPKPRPGVALSEILSVQGMAREALRERVYSALTTEYERLVAEQVVDSPQGHVRSLADAVIKELGL